jgi:hypothetical protein
MDKSKKPARKRQALPEGYEDAANESRIEQYGKQIEALRHDLDDHKTQWGTPEEIAKRLTEAQNDSKKMDKFLADIFCSMIKNDPDVRACVEQMVNDTDRKFFFSTMKKWGKFIGGTVLFLGGYVVNILFELLKKKVGL